MVDYSRFNNIDTDSDDEESNNNKISLKSNANNNTKVNQISSNSQLNNPLITSKEQMTKRSKEGRIRYEFNGQLVYEWEQSLDEVNIYIYPPPEINKAMLVISILPNHLSIGIRGAPPFIDEDLGGHVSTAESTWTFSDGELQIILSKMRKAEAWDCALVGKAGSKIDPYTKEEVKKKLLLERFQEEHPGFDFSGADFNGMVPDAREFMGGIKYG
eukprot:gene20875-27061_t